MLRDYTVRGEICAVTGVVPRSSVKWDCSRFLEDGLWPSADKQDSHVPFQGIFFSWSSICAVALPMLSVYQHTSKKHSRKMTMAYRTGHWHAELVTDDIELDDDDAATVTFQLLPSPPAPIIWMQSMNSSDVIRAGPFLFSNNHPWSQEQCQGSVVHADCVVQHDGAGKGARGSAGAREVAGRPAAREETSRAIQVSFFNGACKSVYTCIF